MLFFYSIYSLFIDVHRSHLVCYLQSCCSLYTRTSTYIQNCISFFYILPYLFLQEQRIFTRLVDHNNLEYSFTRLRMFCNKNFSIFSSTNEEMSSNSVMR